MGAVASGLSWATLADTIRAYCNVDGTTHDTVLQALFNAACAKADTYLNNPFEEIKPTITLASITAGDTVSIGLGRLDVGTGEEYRERYMNASAAGQLAYDAAAYAVYTAATATDEDDLEFKIEATDTLTAVGLVALINSTTLGGSYGAVGVPGVLASNVAGVITLTKRYPNVKDIVVTSSDADRLKVRWVRTSLSLPAEVTQWVCQYVFRHWKNPAALIQESITGATSVTWGGTELGESGMQDNYELIRMYRISPGFGAV